MENQIFSVTELNIRIKELMGLDLVLSNVCVRGEISNYKAYPSGHHYFSLKDANGSLKCVMFKSSAIKLRFKPENGMSVTAFGRIDVYERDGIYQLYCTGIMPEGTGDLQVAFEQLKKKLDGEGLFDAEHKKSLPEFPETIAIVTSAAGAALHDMLRILGTRWPMAKVVLLPVRVQGTEAPAEIAGAIRYANEYCVADLLITGRGGGSIEDLWAFNDERVARAIYNSHIPVISAVGHEPDVTISDYVADVRASTPSNAAEIAVPDQNEIISAIANYRARIEQAEIKKLSILKDRLAFLSDKRVLKDVSAQIDNRRIQLDRFREQLCSAEDKLLAQSKQKFVSLVASMDAMSPLKVLLRGYSIASKADGNVLSRVNDVKLHEAINLRLSDGSIECEVEKINRS